MYARMQSDIQNQDFHVEELCYVQSGLLVSCSITTILSSNIYEEV